MTFKKETTTWKMNHKNYTAYISRWLGTFDTTYFLNIDQDRFDGQYYESFRVVNEMEFPKLNEAKRFAKDYVN